MAALFGLVNMRLCMSACIAAEQQAGQPDNEYLGISQTPIRETLPKLAAIHPRFAEAVFRDACGLTPFPASEKIVDWLTSHADEFASPLDFDLQAGPITVLDLSVSSPLLDSDPAKNTASHLTPRINAAIAEAGAQVGIGRYDEARYFYTSPAFATGDKVTDEYRTIHLGIDLFAPAGTPVYAPLAGTVYAFADNNAPQDYGPVIVLEHKSEEHPTFYTLLRTPEPRILERNQLWAKDQERGTAGSYGRVRCEWGLESAPALPGHHRSIGIGHRFPRRRPSKSKKCLAKLVSRSKFDLWASRLKNSRRANRTKLKRWQSVASDWDAT